MIRGNGSYHEIYQDEDKLAILDKYPIDIGHSLVIPKKPYEKLTDMSVDEVSELFSKIPKIADAIIKATNADGFSIAQNNGRAAKQIIPHVHVHIIPRYNSTGTEWTKRKILNEDDNTPEEIAEMVYEVLENENQPENVWRNKQDERRSYSWKTWLDDVTSLLMSVKLEDIHTDDVSTRAVINRMWEVVDTLKEKINGGER